MSEPISPAPPKKGMSTLVKVLLGCGVLLLLGVGACFVVVGYGAKKLTGSIEEFAKEAQSNPDAAAVRAAALALRLNPEIDVISSDPAGGTITVREKATGKEITFDLEDIKAGKFSIRSGEEETKVDISADEEGGGSLKVTTDQGTATWGVGAKAPPDWIPSYPGSRSDSLASIEANGERSGSFSVNTADAPDVVLAFYEEKLEAAGFEVQRASLSVDGAPSGTLTATSEKRSLSITAAAQDGATQALVTYNEKP
jgi:hypothetical protein